MMRKMRERVRPRCARRLANTVVCSKTRRTVKPPERRVAPAAASEKVSATRADLVYVRRNVVGFVVA